MKTTNTQPAPLTPSQWQYLLDLAKLPWSQMTDTQRGHIETMEWQAGAAFASRQS